MDEVDEVAHAIYDQFPEFFPLSNTSARALAVTSLEVGESLQLIDNLADALMQIKPKPLVLVAAL